MSDAEDVVVDTTQKRHKGGDGTAAGALDTAAASASQPPPPAASAAVALRASPPTTASAAVAALLGAAAAYRAHLDESPALGRAVRLAAQPGLAAPHGDGVAVALAAEAFAPLHDAVRVATVAAATLRAMTSDAATASDDNARLARAVLPAAETIAACLLDDVCGKEVCLAALRAADDVDGVAPPLPTAARQVTAYAAVAGPLLLAGRDGVFDRAVATLAAATRPL